MVLAAKKKGTRLLREEGQATMAKVKVIRMHRLLLEPPLQAGKTTMI
jgi:hypothetical protein